MMQIEVEALRKVRLDEGDVLIVKLPEGTTRDPELVDQALEAVLTSFPNNSVMFTEGEVVVVRQNRSTCAGYVSGIIRHCIGADQ